MNTIKSILLIFGFYIVSSNALAVKVYECEDELGNRTFQAQCSPGSTPVSEKSYSTGRGSNSDDNELASIVLYRVADCIVCDQVKDFVTDNKLTLTEKDVENDFDLQQELKNKNGGQLRVPILLIGDKVLSGYKPDELFSALTNAGYVLEKTEPESENTDSE
jgi:glutaredoxin